MEWIDAPKQVVAFRRGEDFACYINFGSEIELPKNAQVLHSSAPLNGNFLPTDTAVWLRVSK